MFSTPVTLTRKKVRTSNRTARRIQRYSRAGCVGSGWTSGSRGASTSARYSGLVYWRGSGGSGIEEAEERAVELVGALGLGRVAGTFDDGQPAVGNRGVRARGVGDRKQRVVGAPDDLYRHLQLAQTRGHVVLAAEQRPRMHKRSDGGQVRVVEPVSLVHLAQVLQVGVVDHLLEVRAGVGESAGDPADGPRRRPSQRAAREAHNGLANARHRHQAVCHLGHLRSWPPEPERVDEHQPLREVRLFERQLERDAPTERRADDDGAAQAAILHVALDEPREVADRVADLPLPGSPVARQVGRVHAMPGRGGLEVEAPLHVAGGAEAVDEKDGAATPAMDLVAIEIPA